MKPTLDKLGRELKIGDYIAFSVADNSHLYMAKIIKFTPKRIGVAYLDINFSYDGDISGYLDKNPQRMIRVEDVEIAKKRMIT